MVSGLDNVLTGAVSGGASVTLVSGELRRRVLRILSFMSAIGKKLILGEKNKVFLLFLCFWCCEGLWREIGDYRACKVY